MQASPTPPHTNSTAILPIECPLSPEAASIVSAAVHSHLEMQNIDHAWAAWSEAAEHHLWHCAGEYSPNTRQLGRGRLPHLKQQQVRQSNGRKDNNYTDDCACLFRARCCCVEAVRLSNLEMSDPALLSTLLHKVEHDLTIFVGDPMLPSHTPAQQAALRTIHLCHQRPSSTVHWQSLRQSLTHTITLAQLEHRRSSIARWAVWMQHQWEHNPRRVYQWVKDSRRGGVAILSRPDGSITAEPKELDELLHQAWDPIMCKYQDTPEPSVEAFSHQYDPFLLPLEPHVAPRLTGLRLLNRLKQTPTRVAMGLDCWGVAELRCLPLPFFELLADIFNHIESNGQWPLALCQAYCSHIPKGDGNGPLDTRPITVASAVYRLWAGLRLKDLLPWQELWIHPGAAAFRPKFSTEQPATTVALAIEAAFAQGLPLLGVSLDYVKCFDSIPQGILYYIVETQGMDRGVLRALRGMYANTAIRFRVGLPAGLGKAFHPTNGIFQGCPLSVILVNAVVSVWARIMDGLPGGLRPLPDSHTTVTLGMEESFQPIPPEQRSITTTGFADDTYQMESPDPAVTDPEEQVVQCVRHAETKLQASLKYCEATGQSLHPTKSLCFFVPPPNHHPTVTVHLGDHELTSLARFRVLGPHLRTSTQAAGPRSVLRLETGIRYALRLVHAPIGWQGRTTILRTMVLPAALFGVELEGIPPTDLRRFRTAVLRVAWGAYALRRAPEVVLSVLLPGHLFDPLVATPYHQIAWLVRSLRRGDLSTEVILYLLQQPRSLAGPVGMATSTMSQLGWQHVHSSVWCRNGVKWDLTDGEIGATLHHLRADLRLRELQRLERRRPRLYLGIQHDIVREDRPTSGFAFTSLAHLSKHRPKAFEQLRRCLAGALWTEQRLQSVAVNTSAACTVCGATSVLDEEHILWACTGHARIRSSHLEHMSLRWPSLPQPAQWPQCLRLTGLMPITWPPTWTHAAQVQLLYAIHMMYADVLERWHSQRVLAPAPNLQPRSHTPTARRPWDALPSHPNPWKTSITEGIATGFLRPSEWIWPSPSVAHVISWASQLQWPPAGKGAHVTFLELTIDYEAWHGNPVPGPITARFTTGVRSLRDRAHSLATMLQRLCTACPASPPHPSVHLPKARSLRCIRAPVLAGLRDRPHFAAGSTTSSALRTLADYSVERSLAPRSGRHSDFASDLTLLPSQQERLCPPVALVRPAPPPAPHSSLKRPLSPQSPSSLVKCRKLQDEERAAQCLLLTSEPALPPPQPVPIRPSQSPLQASRPGRDTRLPRCLESDYNVLKARVCAPHRKPICTQCRRDGTMNTSRCCNAGHHHPRDHLPVKPPVCGPHNLPRCSACSKRLASVSHWCSKGHHRCLVRHLSPCQRCSTLCKSAIQCCQWAHGHHRPHT